MGFAALGSLSPYKNWFYGLTGILLIVSYYLVAKNGKTGNKLILGVATLVILVMLLFNNRFLLVNFLVG